MEDIEGISEFAPYMATIENTMPMHPLDGRDVVINFIGGEPEVKATVIWCDSLLIGVLPYEGTHTVYPMSRIHSIDVLPTTE